MSHLFEDVNAVACTISTHSMRKSVICTLRRSSVQ